VDVDQEDVPVLLATGGAVFEAAIAPVKAQRRPGLALSWPWITSAFLIDIIRQQEEKALDAASWQVRSIPKEPRMKRYYAFGMQVIMHSYHDGLEHVVALTPHVTVSERIADAMNATDPLREEA